MDAPTPPEPPKGFEPDEPLFVPDFATLPAPPTPETFMRGLEGWAALIDEDGLEPAPRQFTKMPMVKGVCRNENLLVYPVSHSCRIVAWGLYLNGLGPEIIVPNGRLAVPINARPQDTVHIMAGNLEVRFDNVWPEE